MKDHDGKVRLGALAALEQIGPEAKAAVPALVDAMKDHDGKVRLGALAALEKIGPEAKAAVPALVDAMKERNPEQRYLAVKVLGRMGPEAKDALPALANASKDGDAKVRDAAIGALAAAVTMQGLTELLKDKDPAIRSGAARALRRIGPKAKEAVPALTELLKDKDWEVQIAAASALLEIGPEAQIAAIRFWVERLKDKDPRTVEEGWFHLSQVGSAAMPVYRELLKDPAIRSGAGQFMVVIGAPKKKELVPTLIALLKDKEPEARSWAALCLGIIGPAAKDAVPTLLPLLQDNSEIELRFFNGDKVKGKISEVAAGALKAIDPEAAKEAGVK
jgi:HEAT repeat protein